MRSVSAIGDLHAEVGSFCAVQGHRELRLAKHERHDEY
jgi:hypothetical protein